MIEWAGVALGGCLGALARLFISNQISRKWRGDYPLATFLINVTGAFLLGYITVAARPNNLLDDWLRSAIGIGFLGAFTTFSTFMFESAGLQKRRNWTSLAGYLSASLTLGLLGAWLGSLL